MVGSIRWNVIAGCVGFATTFLASLSNNIITTTLLRSVYSALIIFIFIFVLRFLLGFAFGKGGRSPGSAAPVIHKEDGAAAKGQHFDYTTPDDEGDSLKAKPASGQGVQDEPDIGDFAPLAPPKLATRKDLNPEEMVKALRHLSDNKEGE